MQKVDDSPLLVIIGPTASGKTSLAIEIAKKISGEIIAADSRTIFREMNIGTAKPTLQERENIPHWGIDLVDPDEKFTVANFKEYTDAKIREIARRGKLPILVGGSGLYVDAVIFDYEFSSEISLEERANFERMDIAELQKYCKKHNILLPENYKNKRYLINAILRKSVVKNNRKKMRDNTLVIGLNPSKEILLNKIERRIESMFDRGIERETAELLKKYDLDSESMKSNIYRIVARLLNGQISREIAKKNAIIADWHLAKKQLTWFRRNKLISWINESDAQKITSKVEKQVYDWLENCKN